MTSDLLHEQGCSIDELTRLLSIGCHTTTGYSVNTSMAKVVYGDRLKPDSEKSQSGHLDLSFLRVGNRVFVDSRERHRVPEGLDEPDSVIYLAGFEAFMAMYVGNLIYSVPFIHAIESLDLSGRTVLDLGAAEGVLSLQAVRRGAKEVYLVDSDMNGATLLRRHVAVNRLDDLTFSFVNAFIGGGGIEGVPILTRDMLPWNEIDTVFANIGPHYWGADIAAARFVRNLPNVKTFAAGGYDATYGVDSTNGVRRELEALGFCEGGDTSFIKRFSYAAGTKGTIIPQAFVMER